MLQEEAQTIRALKLKPAYFLLGVALVCAIATGISMLGGGSGEREVEAGGANPPAAVRSDPIALPRPSQDLQPAQPVLRIVAPSIELDAVVVVLGVEPDGTMQTPEDPGEVAWYDFSAKPGEGSNVVLAGHFDYVNQGPAALNRLGELQTGADIQLVLGDQSIARYTVSSKESYEEATAPVPAIVGHTNIEVVTLMTCGGSYDKNSPEYGKRTVVRADRIAE